MFVWMTEMVLCVVSVRGKNLFPAGIEPATSPVWRVRDNHYTKETVIFITVIELNV